SCKLQAALPTGRGEREELTLPRIPPGDAPAKSLLSCVFQGGCVAPEGPARPQRTGHPARGGGAAQALAPADGTHSKALVLVLNGGIYRETQRNTMRLARCRYPWAPSRWACGGRQVGEPFFPRLQPGAFWPLSVRTRERERGQKMERAFDKFTDHARQA